MPIQLTCPNSRCGESLLVDEGQLGRQVACRACGQRFEARHHRDQTQQLWGDLDPRTAAPTTRDPRTPSPATRDPRTPSLTEIPEFFGRYRIVRKLGQGGMGAVYLARDVELERDVALKVPNVSLSGEDELIERFRREARAAATFHHPNFCPIHEFGQVGGVHYLAMTFIDGETLHAWARRDPATVAREAAGLVRQLALALAEAHRRGIIHRDLKPANVMIDRRGQPILMDFGIARSLGSSDAELTRTGEILGTPSYMSPEQVRGSRQEIGPATDIYALGVILYELCTGHRPFEGSVTTVISAILHVEPPPPSSYCPSLDPRLEAICLKAMAKKIEDRHASMDALAEALAKALEPTPQVAVDVPPKKRGRSLVFVAIAACLVFMTGLIGYVVTDRGTLKIEGITPDMEIFVDGEQVPIDKLARPIDLQAGEHHLLITQGEAIVHARKTFKVVRDAQTVVPVEPALATAAGSGSSPEESASKTKLESAKSEAERLQQEGLEKARLASLKEAERSRREEIEKRKQEELEKQKQRLLLKSILERGKARLDEKNYGQAENEFNQALEIDPQSVEAYTNRGRARAGLHEYEKAFNDFDEAIRLDPKYALAYYGRGNVWKHKKDLEKALACYNEALRLDPDNVLTLNNRGLVWQSRKEFEKALADFDAAIRHDPNHVLTYLNRGKLWQSRKELEKALADFDEAIRLDPKFTPALNSRGILWQSKHEYDKALVDYNEAIRLDPNYAPAYDNRGLLWQSKHEYGKALIDYNEAIRLDPSDAPAHNNRGLHWKSQKELEKALADFDEAIRLDPNYGLAHLNRGLLWKSKGDLDKAINDLDEAIRLDSDSASARCQRATVWSAKGDLDKAIDDYEAAILIDPKAPDAYADLAFIFAACPDSKYRAGRRAVDLAKQAGDLSSWKNPFMLSTLAAAYAEVGHFEEAVLRQQEAINKAPDDLKNAYKTRLANYMLKMPYRHPGLTPRRPSKP